MRWHLHYLSTEFAALDAASLEAKKNFDESLQGLATFAGPKTWTGCIKLGLRFVAEGQQLDSHFQTCFEVDLGMESRIGWKVFLEMD